MSVSDSNKNAKTTAQSKRTWTNLVEGQVVIGTVKRITNSGAFVDVDGYDCLLRKQDMAWERVNDPADFVHRGEKFQLKVLKIDNNNKQISLGLKQLSEDPWKRVSTDFPIGSKVEGIVTGIQDYGCFVEIKDGVTGLVHKSELDWLDKYIDPEKVLSIDQVVTVKVCAINQEQRRISLSLKQCTPNPWEEFAKSYSIGNRVTGKISEINENGFVIDLANKLQGFTRINEIDWQKPIIANNAQDLSLLSAKITAIDVEHKRISLEINALAIQNYLINLENSEQQLTDLHHLAQGLGLLQNKKEISLNDQAARSEYLRHWFDFIEAIGFDKVKSSAEQLSNKLSSKLSLNKINWIVQLFDYANTQPLLQSCFDLAPASILTKVSLNQLEPLLSKFEQLDSDLLSNYRHKLQSLFENYLYNDNHITRNQNINVKLQLLVLNFKLEPQLYFNLIHYGQCSAATEESNLNSTNSVITNLISLVRSDAPQSYKILELAQLIALIIQARSNDPFILIWAKPWFNDAQISPKLCQQLELLLKPTEASAIEPLKLDLTNHSSIEFLALLPRSLRLAHIELFETSPYFAEFAANELEPIIAPLAKVLTVDKINCYFELLGLQSSAALSEANSQNYHLLQWHNASNEQAALYNKALALCCALNDDSFGNKYEALCTALLVNAPDELPVALTQLQAPELAQIVAHLTPKLYQRTTQPERPWFNPLTQSLVHKLGGGIAHLSATLRHYIVLGPHTLSSNFAHIVPIAPLHQFEQSIKPSIKPSNSAEAAIANSNDVLAELHNAVLARLKAKISNNLSVANFSQNENPEAYNDNDAHDHLYFIYGMIDCIKDTAPVLYDLLKLHLKGAPELISLGALPSVITVQIIAALQNNTSIIDSEDLNAFNSLVLTTSELIAANYPVTYWGSINDLSEIAPEQLTSYSLLMVGQSPQVLLENLEPQALALNINPYSHHENEELEVLLTTYSEQLNIISSNIANKLLHFHNSKNSNTPASGSSTINFDQAIPSNGLSNVISNSLSNDLFAATPDTRFVLSRNQDGTLDLYTLALTKQRQLAAFKSFAVMKLSAQLWPNRLLGKDSDSPLKVRLVSTNPAAKRHPITTYFEAESDFDTEQLLNINANKLGMRSIYTMQRRAQYFAYQVHLITQLLEQIDPHRQICYLIEYERDIAPLRAYINKVEPQLADRLHIISLSALMPQSLCSDLVDLQSAFLADHSLTALPPDCTFIINSLEISAHLELSELGLEFGDNVLSVRHTLMELGLSALAAQQYNNKFARVKALLQERNSLGEQAQNLTLLQGLMLLLYVKTGAVVPSFTFYLLEPSMNDGWVPQEISNLFSDCLNIEPLYLPAFTTITDKVNAENKALPFFNHYHDDTTAALSALKTLAPNEVREPAPRISSDRSSENASKVGSETANTYAETAPWDIYNKDDPLEYPDETAEEHGALNDVPPSQDIRHGLGIEQDQQDALKQLSELTPRTTFEHNKLQGSIILERLAGDDADSKLELNKALKVISLMFIGGNQWRPYQLSALPIILKHQNDCLISLPTGGGKSVLFQGPAYYRSLYSGCLSIVITPLKALMLDQVLALRDKNIKNVDYISSDRPYHEIRRVMSRISSGEITLLYITPERLRSHYFVKTLLNRYEQDNCQGEYFIFDEAHCISQWGKEFRPDYIYAANFIKKLRQRYNFTVIMCSATMTNQVIKDLSQYLNDDYKFLGETGANYNPIRPHIGLTTEQVTITNTDYDNYDFAALRRSERIAAIIKFIRDKHVDFQKSRVLIFCQTRKSTEGICLALENYASYLRQLYQYQCQNPNITFAHQPLVELLYQLDTKASYGILQEELSEQYGVENEIQQQYDAGNQEFNIATADLHVDRDLLNWFEQPSVWEQHLDAKLNSAYNQTYPQTAFHQQLFCDVAVIDPNDPFLQLSQHVGFFHAGMSVRAREHIFNRFKESSSEAIAATIQNRTSLWFNDSIDLSDAENSEHEKNLARNVNPIFMLCATKAFGMGMDLPNIHYVIHAYPSQVFEDYLQEVGRAGRSQEMYEDAFPKSEITGVRAQLPAICLYNQTDFDRAKELVNQSLISWERLCECDKLIQAYLACFGELSEFITAPIVVPTNIFYRDINKILEPLPPYSGYNPDRDDSTLLFYYLEKFGRIELGFKGPCPIQFTIHRSVLNKFYHISDVKFDVTKQHLNFAYNQELKAGPCQRSSDSDILAQNIIITALAAQLKAHDDTAIQQKQTSDESTVVLNEEVSLIFDLQDFWDKCSNSPFASQLSITATINALIEIMASEIIDLVLPYKLCYGGNEQKREEIKYYLEHSIGNIPAITSTKLPLLNITLQVCASILEQSYQDFCTEVKHRQNEGTLARFDDGFNHDLPGNSTILGPLPDYQGIAISNQWIEEAVRKLVEPLVYEFSSDSNNQSENSTNPSLPWLKFIKPEDNLLDSYVSKILLPSVHKGVTVLLQQLPYVKLTKSKATKGTEPKQAPRVLMVKTWSNSFYLMLDLIYEDSWHVLSEISRAQAQHSYSSKEQEQPTILNDWGILLFNLGLRHESCETVLDKYELNWSRNSAQEFYQEISRELNTYNYITNLLSFLKTLGLIYNSALIQYGYEVNLTPESVDLPMDPAIDPQSPFYQRQKELEEINQFKRIRLAVMETYCKDISDENRRIFIEEFFKASENDDYIKHIGNYVGDDSSILAEITASRLALEEEKLRSNPEQWQIYQSPINLNLNVMAGPGSGKTHVLALRCVRMIYHEHIDPESILVLAYNRAVVVELKTRIDQIFTNLGLRRIGRKVPIFTFHSLAKVCLGLELNDTDTDMWEYILISRLQAQPELFLKRFPALRYIMIDEFQDITDARLQLLILLRQQYNQLTIFTIGDINQSIYGFSRIENMTKDPNQRRLLQNGSLSAAEYAEYLGPEPYYNKLYELFKPSTLSLKLNYRSFPKILAYAAPYAFDNKYLSQSAPLLAQYAPTDLGYCARLNITKEPILQAKSQHRRIRSWENDLSNILRFIKERNTDTLESEHNAVIKLGLQGLDELHHHKQMLLAAAALSANSAAEQINQEDAAKIANRNQSPDQILLNCEYRQVKTIALFFRTNNEVYRALEQVRSLPDEYLEQVEIRIQGASSCELWREREFYAIAHFIKYMGKAPLNLSSTLLQEKPQINESDKLRLEELLRFNSSQLYSELYDNALQDPSGTLKLLTQYLMASYHNWDQTKLDMAYCLALSFSSTMASGQVYTWADLSDYYLDLLAHDDGGQCYKLYESLWRYHLDHSSQNRISLTLTTMHKVKGLEYDMVIVTPSQSSLPLKNHSLAEKNQSRFGKYLDSFAQNKSAEPNTPLAVDELADVAEERRLYYVAYTRARKYLYVYYGERELALDQNRRFIAPNEQIMWSEKDEALDKYVLSFNANNEQAGIDDYIAQLVKPHDPVVLFINGSRCHIFHQTDYQSPWHIIGMLSSNSELKRQMQNYGVRQLDGLFISNIVAWTYEDTIKSDIKAVTDKWNELNAQKQQSRYSRYNTPISNANPQQMPDFTNPSVRRDFAQYYKVPQYAIYWSNAAIKKGYCYLITLAGRGTPHQ